MKPLAEDKFERKIERTVRREQLWQKGQRILIACSGGPDSLALLYTLVALAPSNNLELGVVCINHLLRPEGKEEQEMVKRHAQKLGLDFYGETFDIATLAQKNKKSLETMGREVRYQCFAQLKVREQYDLVAIAHHRDDQAETVLAHLIRGSGIKGLQGMTYKREYFIRPFLDVTKLEIREYLARKKLTAAEDLSNYESIYQRNKIRLEIIPLLKTLNPNIENTIHQLAKLAQQDESYLQQVAKDLLLESIINTKEVLHTTSGIMEGISYNKLTWQKAPLAIQSRAWQLVIDEISNNSINRETLNFSQLTQLSQMLTSEEPKEFSHGQMKVWVQYDKIIVGHILPSKACYPSKGKSVNKEEEKNFTISLDEVIDDSSLLHTIEMKKNSFILPLSEIINTSETLKLLENSLREIKKIDWLPHIKSILANDKKAELVIRHRNAGDQIVYLNKEHLLVGHKKVKELLIDKKVPRQERNQLYFLGNERMLWGIISNGKPITIIKQKDKFYIKGHWQEVKCHDAT